MKRYRAMRVAWDNEDGPIFEALVEIDEHDRYVELWNGWLCPLFGVGEVQRLIDWQSNAITTGSELDSLEWQMNDELTELVINAGKTDIDALSGKEVSVEERLEPVMIAGAAFYRPGAWAWTWTDVP